MTTLAYYLAYASVVVLMATTQSALPLFSGVMLAFVLPLTALSLGLMAWRSWVAPRG